MGGTLQFHYGLELGESSKREVVHKERADKCENCAYHHENDRSEDGWYCSRYRRWDCVKSLDVVKFKDYSHMRKGVQP